MKPIRRVFIVGGTITDFIGKKHPDFVWKGHPDFGKRDNPTLEQFIGQAVHGAVAAAGVDPSAVEKGYIGNFAGELFSNQGHLGAMIPRVDPAFEGKPWSRVEGACASGGLAIVSAIEALQAGRDLVMAAGAETQTTVSARDGAGFLARAAHWETERELDEFTFPAMFARRAKFYKDSSGATDEDIAHVVVKAYANANRNPRAHMKAVRIDLATAANVSDANPCFLKHPEYGPHLKMNDCSQVSDGGAAVILATEEGLKKLGRSPADCVEIVSYAQATGALGKVSDYTRMGTTERAVAEAFSDTGLKPSDMGVAEVHDCFSVTECLMAEAIGFTPRGKGWTLAKEGRSAIDGDIPINTGGGLIAFGHPVGATGVKQVFEVARQMLGKCGDYQVPTPPKYGISANMGGDDRSSVVMIMRSPGA